MASMTSVKYELINPYNLEEDLFKSVDEWYNHVTTQLRDLSFRDNNGVVKNNIPGQTNIILEPNHQTMLRDALEYRFNKEGETENVLGIIGDIIGEYRIEVIDESTIEDYTKILNQFIEYFNNSIELTSKDPVPTKVVVEEEIVELSEADAIRRALYIATIGTNMKLSMGAVMGSFKNYPVKDLEVKTIASKIPPLIQEFMEWYEDKNLEEVITYFEDEFPNFEFKEKKKGKDKNKKGLTNRFEYFFGMGDVNPQIVYYEDTTDPSFEGEITLSNLIKQGFKVKSDKKKMKLYEWMTNHTPGGPMWPIAKGGSYGLVITNRPMEQITISTGRPWAQSSCARLIGAYKNTVFSDVKYNNLASYFFANGSIGKDGTQSDLLNINEDWPEVYDGTLKCRLPIRWGFADETKDMAKGGRIGFGTELRPYPPSNPYVDSFGPYIMQAIYQILDAKGVSEGQWKEIISPHIHGGASDRGKLGYNKRLKYVSMGGGKVMFGRSGEVKIDEDRLQAERIQATDFNLLQGIAVNLSRKRTPLEIRRILSQNPSIWLWPNSVDALIHSHDYDILHNLIDSPLCSAEFIIKILRESQKTFEGKQLRKLVLAGLTAPHYNVEVEDYLLGSELYHLWDNVKVGGIHFGQLGDYGFFYTPQVHPTNVYATEKMLDTLIDDFETNILLNKDIPNRIQINILTSLLFAYYLTPTQFGKLQTMIATKIPWNKYAHAKDYCHYMLWLNYVLPLHEMANNVRDMGNLWIDYFLEYKTMFRKDPKSAEWIDASLSKVKDILNKGVDKKDIYQDRQNYQNLGNYSKLNPFVFNKADTMYNILPFIRNPEFDNYVIQEWKDLKIPPHLLLYRKFDINEPYYINDQYELEVVTKLKLFKSISKVNSKNGMLKFYETLFSPYLIQFLQENVGENPYFNPYIRKTCPRPIINYILNNSTEYIDFDDTGFRLNPSLIGSWLISVKQFTQFFKELLGLTFGELYIDDEDLGYLLKPQTPEDFENIPEYVEYCQVIDKQLEGVKKNLLSFTNALKATIPTLPEYPNSQYRGNLHADEGETINTGLLYNDRLSPNIQNFLLNNLYEDLVSYGVQAQFKITPYEIKLLLAENPNTTGANLRFILDQSVQKGESSEITKLIGMNPNCPLAILGGKNLTKLRGTIFFDYPIEVLNNPQITDHLYYKLFNYIDEILKYQIAPDTFNLASFADKSLQPLLSVEKGVTLRKKIRELLTENIKNLEYWRGGYVLAGSFSDLTKTNLWIKGGGEGGIADTPFFGPEEDSYVLKWNSQKNNNELIHITSFLPLTKNNFEVEGSSISFNEKGVLIETEINGTYTPNSFFGFIEEEDREDIKTIEICNACMVNKNIKYKLIDLESKERHLAAKHDGEVAEEVDIITVEEPPRKWTHENVFIFSSKVKLQPSKIDIPEWRYAWDQATIETYLSTFFTRFTSQEFYNRFQEDLPLQISLSNNQTAQINIQDIFRLINNNQAWQVEFIDSNIELIFNNMNATTIDNFSNFIPTFKFIEYSISDVGVKEADQQKLISIYTLFTNYPNIIGSYLKDIYEMTGDLALKGRIKKIGAKIV